MFDVSSALSKDLSIFLYWCPLVS